MDADSLKPACPDPLAVHARIRAAGIGILAGPAEIPLNHKVTDVVWVVECRDLEPGVCFEDRLLSVTGTRLRRWFDWHILIPSGFVAAQND